VNAAGQPGPADRIYCCRGLRLDQVAVVGFDLDYTLARYEQHEMEPISVAATLRRLVEKGYPAWLAEVSWPREFATRGLLIDVHGFVAAADLTRALATAARRHGAQLIEPSRVRRIARSGGDVTVDTDRGSLTGGAVVIAAGSWSGEIAIDGIVARVPVRPVRGQLLTLAWTGMPLRRVTWSSRCYLVPWDDGTLLVGATVEEAGFDERATVAGVRDLLDAASEIVPHAWSAGFKGVRVGLRPATSDELPVIGASERAPNVMYATGHFRNGVLLAPLTATLVADAMVDGKYDPLLAALGPSRFGDL